MTTAPQRWSQPHRPAPSRTRSAGIVLALVLVLQALVASPASAAVGATTVNLTVNGTRAVLRLPARASEQAPVPVVIHFRGLAGDGITGNNLGSWDGMAKAALAAGFAVATCDCHRNQYGSPAAMTGTTELWRQIQDTVPTGGLYVSGDSHGGIGALNAITTGALTGVDGAYLAEPVVSLRQRYTSIRERQITAAYGLAADGSDYDAKTAGYDPALRPASDFHGVPMSVTASPADTTVPKAKHTDVLVGILGTDQVQVTTASGRHGDGSHFDKTAYVAFLEGLESGAPTTPAPTTPAPTTPPVAGGTTPPAARPARLEGSDRYGTSAAISRGSYSSAATVVIASGEAFPDALAAAPLAGDVDGPVLLVRPGSVPPDVATELQRLQPERAVVIGGPSSVSEDVVTDLRRYVTTVERIGGADRYATAADVATEGLAPGRPVAEVLVASGEQFPDGLAAGAYGAATGTPLLLTRRDVLPPTTAQALAALAPSRVVVLGGPASISAEVSAQLAAYAASGTVVRVAGDDRYETAAAVAEQLFAGVPATRTLLASGEQFPDALSGAALGQPLLLTRTGCLPPRSAEALGSRASSPLTVLGGLAAVSDEAAGGRATC